MAGPTPDEDNAATARRAKGTLRWSQETIAIVAVGATIITVGATLIAQNIVTAVDLREMRQEWQAENRALREAARSDREASERKFEVFQREILRLTEGQAELAALARSRAATPP